MTKNKYNGQHTVFFMIIKINPACLFSEGVSRVRESKGYTKKNREREIVSGSLQYQREFGVNGEML